MAAAVTPFGLPRVLTTAFHHKSRQEKHAVHDQGAGQSKAPFKAPAASNQQAGAKKSKPPVRKWKRVTPRQVLRLTHRFAITCAAFVYITMSFEASWDALYLLNDSTGVYIVEGAYTSDALALHIGTTTLRESPFVVQSLGNDTTPRHAALYYDMETTSFEPCKMMSPLVYDIYSAAFQQTLYTAITTGAAYNLTSLAASEIELIVPLVDCTNYIVTSGDETMANLNFLVRRKQDPNDVFMLTFTFVNQAYKIYSQKEYGPAAVGTLTFLNDLRVTRVDSYFLVSLGYPFEPFDFRVYELVGWSDHGSWLLQKIVSSDPADLPKVVRTGTRSGFFMTTDSDQTNIFTEHWEVSTTDPVAAITGPMWFTKSATHDSWAWTHLLQLVFGLSHLSGLVVLTMVSYRNLVAGKLWIGDAFVAISGNIVWRGVLVVLSWYFNGFWAFLEFCLYDMNQLTNSMHMTIYESILLVDLLTIYLSCCGVLGKVFRERIDPLIALVSFFIGFIARRDIIHWFPQAEARLKEFVSAFYQLGSPQRIEGQEEIAPMRLWNTHELTSIPIDVICYTLLPIFCTLVIVLTYIAVRKVHRHFHPDPMRAEKASSLITTAKSETGADSKNSKEQTSVLTLFEIATGAKLANKFGLLAEYDNCLFIKGMKFATPDGIYSSGFVIVNSKYLIQAADFWSILLMKFLRVRYTNLYMYEVNGSTVEQVARLVYPSTFTLVDLLSLNTNILS
ncbi:hypothetical protein Gpo141_00011161 [Globisporangium polare]